MSFDAQKLGNDLAHAALDGQLTSAEETNIHAQTLKGAYGLEENEGHSVKEQIDVVLRDVRDGQLDEKYKGEPLAIQGVWGDQYLALKREFSRNLGKALLAILQGKNPQEFLKNPDNPSRLLDCAKFADLSGDLTKIVLDPGKPSTVRNAALRAIPPIQRQAVLESIAKKASDKDLYKPVPLSSTPQNNLRVLNKGEFAKFVVDSVYLFTTIEGKLYGGFGYIAEVLGQEENICTIRLSPFQGFGYLSRRSERGVKLPNLHPTDTSEPEEVRIPRSALQPLF